MYVRMVWGKLRRRSWQENERHYRTGVASLNDRISGVKERRLLRSTDHPNEGVSLTIWDSLDSLNKFETSSVRQENAREVELICRGEYWVKHFEVTSSN